MRAMIKFLDDEHTIIRCIEKMLLETPSVRRRIDDKSDNACRIEKILLGLALLGGEIERKTTI